MHFAACNTDKIHKLDKLNEAAPAHAVVHSPQNKSMYAII